MGWIRINNMRFYTYNGVLPEEKRLGQRLEIDVALAYPVETAVKDDDLKTTVSYADVYETIRDFVEKNSFDLIETVANRVCDLVLTIYPSLTAVRLRVRKYSVPIAGQFDNVEIEVEKQNAHPVHP